MPIGAFINNLPMPIFVAIHLAAFLIGVYFAWGAFNKGAKPFGWGFVLYAVAEIAYLTYHLDWTVFLFAHTIAEVLDLLAFILIFAGLAQAALGRRAR